ncbi:MAG: restriction endonuclease [Fimbriimonadaceae bacterium]|nr:restriction endonuclease [Fimbriimonadaceae bacterium]
MIRLHNHDDSRRYSDHSSSNVFIALERKVRNLDFPSFQICTLLWLSRQGFSHVRSLGRCHQRGRRKNGGADFVALASQDPQVKIAIQLRHCQTPVQRRAIDELWGFMLRNGIPTGLVVSNGRYQDSAQRAINEYPGRPVQLVSLQDLSRSMINLGLGIVQTDTWRVLDERYFDSLTHLRLAGCSVCTANTEPRVHVRPLAVSQSEDFVDVRSGPPSDPLRWVWYVVMILLILAFFASLWLAKESF